MVRGNDLMKSFHMSQPSGRRFKTNHVPMKHILFLLLTFTTVLAITCNKQRQAIDAQNDAPQTSIDHQKEAVAATAKEAKSQTETDTKIDKANIEAKQAADQAQLDAEKKQADAFAAAAKAKIDIE
jgi:hypothetical protein